MERHLDGLVAGRKPCYQSKTGKALSEPASRQEPVLVGIFEKRITQPSALILIMAVGHPLVGARPRLTLVRLPR